MKKQVGILDAVPSKRLFLSIIADYDLNKSICELVDNGFDVWTRAGHAHPICISVELNIEQSSISVEDNAGGLHKDELRFIVGPGQSGSAMTDQTIGIFGVGTKRAVVALAQDIKIRTRYEDSETHQVEFDDTWLNDNDWELPLFVVDNIAPRTTRVDLTRLRLKIDRTSEETLREHLSATYAKFVVKSDVVLTLNGKLIGPKVFDNWSYPPRFEPRHYSGTVLSPTKRTIKVDVLAGLGAEASPTLGEYGVYFYCNERLVAPAMKSFDVGFTSGQAGNPHPKISLTKVIVQLSGDAGDMPWNSSKSDINTKHPTFIDLHDWLVKVVADFAKISRTWMGQWPEKVYAHPTGDLIKVQIDNFVTERSSFLPDAPKSRPRLADRLEQNNRKLVGQKPWTKPLYEGIVAATTISKQPLGSSNWFAYYLLDLTLRMALKNYVFDELDLSGSGLDLKTALQISPKVSDYLRENVPLTEPTWIEIEKFSKLLDRQFNSTTTPIISDDQLKKAEDLIHGILVELFNLTLDD